MDDALLAYGQNGEALRPEQGYPLRLLLPGWEGNTNVKWLARSRSIDQPYDSREETSKYTDLMPDGTARIFTFDMEAKSIITSPRAAAAARTRRVADHRLRLVRARYDSRGWSDVDGGPTWTDGGTADACSQGRLRGSGGRGVGRSEATLVSRCTDDTGYVQPPRCDANRNTRAEVPLSQQWHPDLAGQRRTER